MEWLNRFYLDKEKDMIVDLYMKKEQMHYVLSTPNHKTGNLITNLARLCKLPLSNDKKGLKVIKGKVPCYIDGYNRSIYIFRLGNTKVANISSNGQVEMKASIPSISKTLMSQTKNYTLDIQKTIVKTYIHQECKFRTDLHTHMNANLHPDLLIALGIFHEIRYPLYYVKKLKLEVSAIQKKRLESQRRKVEKEYKDSPLKGKYLTRKIDDHTYINFADLILNYPSAAGRNIAKIRASLSVMKDGQAVFTNLEKVYLYRYVFAKGVTCTKRISLTKKEKREKALRLADTNVGCAYLQMLDDQNHPVYKKNTLFQNKLLWIARYYQRQGIQYAEISDTTLTKKEGAASMLAQVHEVMPTIIKETGVLLRFLAAIRRIPLTIVRDNVVSGDYFEENLKVIQAIAHDPYVAGSDIVGEEINDIRQIEYVVNQLVKIARLNQDFVIRIHAGENDSLRDNVYHSIHMIQQALAPNQKMPHLRIGHGLYTANLNSSKGKELIQLLKKTRAVLEFQITSNVRLNNLSQMDNHPLRLYLKHNLLCVQGTDGGALYGTDSIDEQLSLEKMLGLTYEEMVAMKKCDQLVYEKSLEAFEKKMTHFPKYVNIESALQKRIDTSQLDGYVSPFDSSHFLASEVFENQIEQLPRNKEVIVLVGGSFNNDTHTTKPTKDMKEMISWLLEHKDPKKTVFVIGHRLNGYEGYLLKENKGRFDIYAFVPSVLDQQSIQRLKKRDVKIRVSIEPVSMGLYKSVAYEVFKQRDSILLALDGNSAAANMVQEAKNAKYDCSIYVNQHCRMLAQKAQSLKGYVTILNEKNWKKELKKEVE